MLRLRDPRLLAGSVCALALLSLPAITESSLLRFDALALHAIADLRSPTLTTMFSFFSLLGSTVSTIVVALVAIAGLWLAAPRGKALGFGLIISVTGSTITHIILKDLVARDRPLHALVFESTYSFPSGHAAVAAALYGFLAVCAWHVLPRKAHRITGVSLCISVALLIAISRVYLGVHYPLDVIAGLCVGCSWVLLGVFAVHSVRRSALTTD